MESMARRRNLNVVLNVAATIVTIVTLSLTFVLMLQSSNRYEWMLFENVQKLPQDIDSAQRVFLFVKTIVLSSLCLWMILLVRHRQRLWVSCWFWLSLIPLGYAIWRSATV